MRRGKCQKITHIKLTIIQRGYAGLNSKSRDDHIISQLYVIYDINSNEQFKKQTFSYAPPPQHLIHVLGEWHN